MEDTHYVRTVRLPVYWRELDGWGGGRVVRLFDILCLPGETVVEFKQGHDRCRVRKSQLLQLLAAAEAEGDERKRLLSTARDDRGTRRSCRG